MGINVHLARPKSDILRIASLLREERRIFCNIGWIATAYQLLELLIQFSHKQIWEREKDSVPGPEVSSPGGRHGAGAALVSQLLPQGASTISHTSTSRSHPQSWRYCRHATSTITTTTDQLSIWQFEWNSHGWRTELPICFIKFLATRSSTLPLRRMKVARSPPSQSSRTR